MVVVVAAAAVAVVVAVVRGGKLALGCIGARTFSAFYAQHQGQAFGAARVYWACRPRAAWGGMRVLGVLENWAGKKQPSF